MDVWTGSTKNCSTSADPLLRHRRPRLGLFSRALTSPDGKIRIPITRTPATPGQIEDISTSIRGEGIQHIACGRGISTRPSKACRVRPAVHAVTAGYYFERSTRACPGIGEDVARLQRDGILIDGEGVVDGGHTKVLLQIFSANAIGPIFFRIHPAQGRRRFGEGKLQGAVRIDRGDQIRRGVLKVDTAA